jgi:hypothetical protein
VTFRGLKLNLVHFLISTIHEDLSHIKSQAMSSKVFEHSATEWKVVWKKLVCIHGHCNHSKMATSCPKMVTACFYDACVRACVSTYQTAWRNIPEEHNAHCHHNVNLKSHNYFIFTPVNFTMY